MHQLGRRSGRRRGAARRPSARRRPRTPRRRTPGRAPARPPAGARQLEVPGAPRRLAEPPATREVPGIGEGPGRLELEHPLQRRHRVHRVRDRVVPRSPSARSTNRCPRAALHVGVAQQRAQERHVGGHAEAAWCRTAHRPAGAARSPGPGRARSPWPASGRRRHRSPARGAGTSPPGTRGSRLSQGAAPARRWAGNRVPGLRRRSGFHRVAVQSDVLLPERERLPGATRSCSSTRSRPVTISVTGCSTCSRVFISMKKWASAFEPSTMNSTVRRRYSDRPRRLTAARPSPPAAWRLSSGTVPPR